jgi:hypothetical protein
MDIELCIENWVGTTNGLHDVILEETEKNHSLRGPVNDLLLYRIKEGRTERDPFGLMFKLNMGLLITYLNRYSGNDREELFASLSTCFAETVDRFEPGRGSFYNFLSQALKREAINFHQRESEFSAWEWRHRQKIQKAADTFNTDAEIAEHLGLNEGLVSRVLSRKNPKPLTTSPWPEDSEVLVPEASVPDDTGLNQDAADLISLLRSSKMSEWEIRALRLVADLGKKSATDLLEQEGNDRALVRRRIITAQKKAQEVLNGSW